MVDLGISFVGGGGLFGRGWVLVSIMPGMAYLPCGGGGVVW